MDLTPKEIGNNRQLFLITKTEVNMKYKKDFNPEGDN